MRALEQQVAATRARFRRLVARVGSTEPGRVHPERLVVRLDDGDLAGSLGAGEPLSPSQWHKAIVGAVQWLGPLPVTVLASQSAASPVAADLIRFAHRLECPTLLVTNGVGVTDAVALDLIDRGLRAVVIRMGGVSEEVHASVVGGRAADAAGAVRSFVQARATRGFALDIEVALPWQGNADSEARALLGWAQQAGADGFRVTAPWRADDLPADPELLDELAASHRPFHRTPMATFDELHAMVAHQDGQPGLSRGDGPSRRRRGRCPVGGQRVEITAHGQVSACPFKGAIGVFDADFKAVWMGGGAHLEAIRSCDRACAHPELAPSPVLR